MPTNNDPLITAEEDRANAEPVKTMTDGKFIAALIFFFGLCIVLTALVMGWPK